MASKRTRVKLGDVVAIPLEESMVAVGIVLHISTVFRGSIMIGFYNESFASIDEIDIGAVGGDFIETPNYTGKQVITSGRWKVVGNNQALLSAANIPQLRVANTLYFKNEIIRQLHTSEFQEYVEVAGQGAFFIEDKLLKHFGKVTA